MKEAMDLDTLFDAMKEAHKKARNLITIVRNKNQSNATNARKKNDNKAKHLADINNDRRPPPLPSGGESQTAEDGAKPQIKPSPSTRITLSQTNPCLACVPAEVSEQTNEFLDRMEERKKAMNLAIVAKNLEEKKKRKAPDKATIVKTWDPRENKTSHVNLTKRV